MQVNKNHSDFKLITRHKVISVKSKPNNSNGQISSSIDRVKHEVKRDKAVSLRVEKLIRILEKGQTVKKGVKSTIDR